MDNPLKKINPKQRKYLIGAAAVAGVYVAYRWYTAEPSTSTTTTTTSSTDDELAETGIIGSNVGGSENVGNSSNTSTSLIDSNPKWFDAATEKLQSAGWNPQVVQSALGDFLTGQTLTSEEASIVRAAVGQMGGYPPQGPTSIKESAGSTPLPETKLKAPTGLKIVSKTSTSVTLSWSKVTGATGYRVYRSGVPSNIGASLDTKLVVGGLQPGVKYTFYVAATLSGEKTGPRSAGISATTEKKKLTAPTGLKVSSIGKTSARLTWNATYPGQYVYRRSGSSQTLESVDNSTALTGLKPRTKYSYQVAAVEYSGRTIGPWSKYVTFTTKR